MRLILLVFAGVCVAASSGAAEEPDAELKAAKAQCNKVLTSITRGGSAYPDLSVIYDWRSVYALLDSKQPEVRRMAADTLARLASWDWSLRHVDSLGKHLAQGSQPHVRAAVLAFMLPEANPAGAYAPPPVLFSTFKQIMTEPTPPPYVEIILRFADRYAVAPQMIPEREDDRRLLARRVVHAAALTLESRDIHRILSFGRRPGWRRSRRRSSRASSLRKNSRFPKGRPTRASRRRAGSSSSSSVSHRYFRQSPTIHRGLALFGCTDGWVYAVRAEDGVEAWRFRVAPFERLVGGFGRTESAWPVKGSVLVQDGKAYAIAARSCSDLLDDSGFNRTYWIHARRWPGFYFGPDAPKTGRMLVFDDSTTYGVKAHAGKQGQHSPIFFPGKEGWLLFADDNASEPVLDEKSRNSDKGKPGLTRGPAAKWSAWTPILVRAMVLTGALRHLDAACGIPELDMVQWQPGAGNAQTQDWTAVCDRIDALGKGQTRGGNGEKAVRVWRSLRSRQVFFSLDARTRTEAEDCLAALEAATAEKPEPPAIRRRDRQHR